MKESKNEYKHLSILKSLSSHNDNWGFFIPRNKAVTVDQMKEIVSTQFKNLSIGTTAAIVNGGICQLVAQAVSLMT